MTIGEGADIDAIPSVGNFDSVKMSMHWAVKGKKDLMLEESEQTHISKTKNEEWNEQREIKKEELGSTKEKIKQKAPSPWRSQSPHKIQSLQVFQM
ncbi:Hypothetical predicted protein [Marmota monax]|uniref:Uncharacterized protein n=1 Tax=Marmota monax TaxID=9995 RepID=A0A5E4CYC5_MARMO|nr:hypothetical protein GHT09_015030 [Marmota monax]VTJ86868.1 Hypothetical predicted protein [Marmota monax]